MLKTHSNQRKTKKNKFNNKLLYKKMFWSEILNNCINLEKIKPLYMDKFKELWLLAEIYNLILIS
jgi:hypothetical protein